MATKLTTREAVNAFIDRHDTFLFDCDGVLWYGHTLIPGVDKTLELLRRKGKRILFVTNNSTQSRQAYTKKFEKLGLSASENEIFGSSYAAAVYLQKVVDFPADKQVYVIGQAGICDELDAASIRHNNPADDSSTIDWEGVEAITPDPNIGAVLVGFDMEINYRKLAKAYVYLASNPGCLFLATNDDASFPHHGRTFPGTGSMVAAIKGCTGREPRVLGKPHQTMLDCIVAKYDLDRTRTCMVGDRLNTDIQFGVQGGMSTLLVLTGVTSEQELHDARHNITPEYYADSLATLNMADTADE
ncbi:HAD-like domain-containing protein [Syncephalis pseudoplumigaleata]|uniref:4-nitrophenylphosphatase n=1 Tax=Syncephalis pseudoplumigaleata TaxID=1712513 RepID=A0A4P9YXE7_9FUNG|nr:HAD-like domain-containing protein [Syncephalis pseudoplumigaleata]|eukprot:RKP24001.1 HAD-like domain-containing protein [Syncephalis pseudoplumigaleata]